MNDTHIPVMAKEVLEWLNPVTHGIYVDGTFGRGGYTRAILAVAGTKVWAIDRDPQAVAAGEKMATEYPGRLRVIAGRFGEMGKLLNAQGITEVDGVTLDLGVSSPQLDEAERGFSFRFDGPLDMRMGNSGRTAADVVNTLKEEELADIFYYLGEERHARKVARAIVKAREEKPITRTLELAAIIRRVVPAAKDRLDPATRSFQGLRIFVNDEMDELTQGLEAAKGLLKKGGRLVVVSFHSIEDRVVKHFMRGGDSFLSRHLPMPVNDSKPEIHTLTNKAIAPGEDEIRGNPRAASAKLRAAEKTGEAAKKESSRIPAAESLVETQTSLGSKETWT
jgi:16S rRNA (cytosine1402-N4)-methyltransferase